MSYNPGGPGWSWPPQPPPPWPNAPTTPGWGPPKKQRRWRKWLGIGVIAVLLVLAAVTTTVLIAGRPTKACGDATASQTTRSDTQGCRTPAPSAAPTSTRPTTMKYAAPQQLFTDLDMPRGVGVDAAGNIYVADAGHHQVLKYAFGATAGSVLPFGDIFPIALAVDGAGTVYVNDTERVLKLAAGASSPVELPFGEVAPSDGVAVDTAGAVYITEKDTHTGTGQVLKLDAGAAKPVALPFPALQTPKGLAVDDVGTVYVADFDKKAVYKLAKDAISATELPFGARSWLHAVAVDSSSGTVYVTQIDLDDNFGRVLALPSGASAPTELPFTGLQWPQAVTVDSSGSVYVADGEPNGNTGRIVKMATQ